MNRHSFGAVATTAILFAGFAGSTASAAPPADVVIHLQPCAFAPAEVGSWNATGAINDSGSYQRTDAETSPPDRPFFSTGPVHETFVLTSVQGAFTVATNSRVTDSGQPGAWSISDGAGTYADTSGHGDFAVAFSPLPSCLGGFTVIVTLTGVAGKVGTSAVAG